MMSSSQNKESPNDYSILPKKDPKTTAIIAMMRGKPKDGHHRHCSNKHHKQKLVQVLLDSGSDGNLVFVDKDKPVLLPFSKRLVPHLWNTSNEMFQTKHKARIKLNFFEYSNSKRYLAEPDIVKYDKKNKQQYDLIVQMIDVSFVGEKTLVIILYLLNELALGVLVMTLSCKQRAENGRKLLMA